MGVDWTDEFTEESFETGHVAETGSVDEIGVGEDDIEIEEGRMG